MKTKIYALQDEDGRIRYVGKTSKNLSKRFRYHLYDARRGFKNHRCNWIRSLLVRGFLPSIIEIGEADGDGGPEEIAWIKYFRDEGVNLVNETEGGEGVSGFRQSAETCRKKSEIFKGRIFTPEWREKIRVFNTGRHHLVSPEIRKKWSLARLGKAPWNKGKHTPPEVRRKQSLAKQNMSVETRRKIGLANRNRSPEINRKIALSLTGLKASPETRVKMSLSGRAVWNRRKLLQNV